LALALASIASCPRRARSPTFIGNAVAAVVIGKSENAFDRDEALAEYRRFFDIRRSIGSKPSGDRCPNHRARKGHRPLIAHHGAAPLANEGAVPGSRTEFRDHRALYDREAYEVADAIEKRDMAGLKDELGDLLFQVVFHGRMRGTGLFGFADYRDASSEKMIGAIPCFADAASVANAADQVVIGKR